MKYKIGNSNFKSSDDGTEMCSGFFAHLVDAR